MRIVNSSFSDIRGYHKSKVFIVAGIVCGGSIILYRLLDHHASSPDEARDSVEADESTENGNSSEAGDTDHTETECAHSFGDFVTVTAPTYMNQ